MRGNYTFIIFIFISFSLPELHVGFLHIPFYFVPVPFMFLYLLSHKLVVTKNFLVFAGILMLAVIQIFITNFFQPLIKLGTIGFSFDFIMLFVKLLYFVFFFHIIYSNRQIGPNGFLKLFLVVVGAGMIIGLIQWFNLFGEWVSELYTFNERGYKLATNQVFLLRRVSGIAHFATSLGGISMFISLLAIVFYAKFKQSRLLITIIIVLSLLNLFACQGRGGQLAFIFGLLLFGWMELKIKLTKKQLWLIVALIMLILVIILLIMYSDYPIFRRIRFRFRDGFDQIMAGNNRVSKISKGFDLIENPLDFLIGVSRVVETKAGDIFIESEFFNIFILYGILGVLLHYGFIIIFLFYVYRYYNQFSIQINLKNYLLATFIGIFSYQIFSIGYYFFREVYVGQIPFVIMGSALGFIERYNKYKV